MCQHFATRMGPPNQAYEKSNFRRIFCKLYKYQKIINIHPQLIELTLFE